MKIIAYDNIFDFSRYTKSEMELIIIEYEVL